MKCNVCDCSPGAFAGVERAVRAGLCDQVGFSWLRHLVFLSLGRRGVPSRPPPRPLHWHCRGSFYTSLRTQYKGEIPGTGGLRDQGPSLFAVYKCYAEASTASWRGQYRGAQSQGIALLSSSGPRDTTSLRTARYGEEKGRSVMAGVFIISMTAS